MPSIQPNDKFCIASVTGVANPRNHLVDFGAVTFADRCAQQPPDVGTALSNTRRIVAAEIRRLSPNLEVAPTAGAKGVDWFSNAFRFGSCRS